MRYTVNQYGQLFAAQAEPSIRPGAIPSFVHRRRRRPRAGLWARQWAWFRSRGPWGQALILLLIWPVGFSIVAVLAAVGVVIAVVAGVLYGVLAIIRTLILEIH